MPMLPVEDPGHLFSPAFVLVAPQLGENIGAAARAMWNFGLDDLRLVSPRDGWPNPQAWATASGALHVLERVRLFATTSEAVADLKVVYASTARRRDMTKTIMPPSVACHEIRKSASMGEKTGVLFGCERSGLETEDVNRARNIIHVPNNPDFSSLNLAQCVLLIAYEWHQTTLGIQEASYDPGPFGMATHKTVDDFLKHLTSDLEESGYFWPEARRGAMQKTLENIFRRAPLTDQDVRTLRGVVRTLSKGRRRKTCLEKEKGLGSSSQ